MARDRPGAFRAAAAALVLAAAGLFALGFTPTAEAAGTFQAATTANSAGVATTSLTLNVPSGTTANDQLLAQIAVVGGSAIIITPPTGGTWTVVGTVSSGATGVDLIQTIYRRTATASEPASYTWTFTSGKAAGAVLRYSGIDADIPLDALASTSSSVAANPTAPASVASYGSETVVHFVAKNDPSTFTAAAGTTERTDSGAFAPGTQGSDETQAASGATTARSPTSSTAPAAASVVGHTIVLRSETAAIKLRGVTLPATTAPTLVLALTPPTATVQGDVMIAQVVVDRAAAITAPAGWAQIITTTSGGTTTADLRQSIYSKVAATSETAPYTWTSTQKLDGAILVYAGVDTANPTDGTTASQVTATGTTVTAPALTTTKANGMLLGFFACADGRCDPLSQPANMNERVDSGQTPVVAMADADFGFASDDKPLGAAGVQPAFTSTSSRTGKNIGTTVALRPADIAFSAATSNAFETSGTVSFTVSLSGAISIPATVAYTVTGGLATAGTDYTIAAGTASIAAGSTSTTFSLAIVDDANPDDPDGITRRDETVIFTLSSPRNANLGAQATHTLTIKDDEPKILTSIVLGSGAVTAAAWGAWTAIAGASNVASANYLKVVNNHPDPAARPIVTVDFSSASLAGVTDPAQLIALDNNIQFSCKEDTTGVANPASLTFSSFGAASPTGSATMTFTAATGSSWYCRHQLVAVPDPALDQDYQASFTVVAG